MPKGLLMQNAGARLKSGTSEKGSPPQAGCEPFQSSTIQLMRRFCSRI
ncbi:hypothetical protein NBRC111894_3888 [Sporolactobacillus inulinus]|uniref:Uncharacterized protein n=1 Tax=Sporolactobacillus inulinus TaxID=2078 RepID=A0A4Y1ZHF1_9BACL|nr:hypothetical protein NBRC111894_3888 [Sporolactobacillus inulinus]